MGHRDVLLLREWHKWMNSMFSLGLLQLPKRSHSNPMTILSCSLPHTQWNVYITLRFLYFEFICFSELLKRQYISHCFLYKNLFFYHGHVSSDPHLSHQLYLLPPFFPICAGFSHPQMCHAPFILSEQVQVWRWGWALGLAFVLKDWILEHLHDMNTPLPLQYEKGLMQNSLHEDHLEFI